MTTAPSRPKRKSCNQHKVQSSNQAAGPLNYFDQLANPAFNYAQALPGEFLKVFDTRKSDFYRNIFNGFYAIHYAIFYGNVRTFTSIFKTEFHTVTKEAATIRSAAIGYNPFNVADNSNILHLALLCNQSEMIDLIVKYMEACPQVSNRLMNQKNSQGQKAYTVAALCHTEDALKILKHPMFVENYFSSQHSADVTPFSNAVQYVCVNNLQALVDLAQDDFCMPTAYRAALHLNSQDKKNLLDQALERYNIAQFGVSKGDRRKCLEILYYFMKKAFEYFQTNNKAVCDVFMGENQDAFHEQEVEHLIKTNEEDGVQEIQSKQQSNGKQKKKAGKK